MQGWVRASCVIALAEKDENHGLFVFSTCRVPPQLFSDLTLERVLLIDNEFRCEIDTESRQQDGGVDIYVNISSRKTKLLFEMTQGIKTSNFVGEIFRAIEVYTKRKGPSSSEFAWLLKYIRNLEKAENYLEDSELKANQAKMSSENSAPASLVDLGSPDLVLPRQNIARGASPIAARESVIRHQMAMKEHHFTYNQSLKIYTGTWNVNGKPPTIALGDWLATDPEPPDIYAIGFQELDLSKEAFLFNDTPREEEWLKAVMNGLHPKAKYRKVELVRLVGMMLIVFVQEQHVAYIRSVSCETVGTGIMGKMGNKGGVGIRFEFHSSSICFINSHLAAHVEEFERRNQDFHDICSRMAFTAFTPPKSIKDHEHIYWLGDLNYRITDLDRQKVKELIDHNSFDEIIKADQLYQQRQAKTVFVGYHEGDLSFRPTYKYDVGTDNWDSSEKNRAPAWCDRILWKGDGIKQITYRSHPELRISDHKPVSALFESQIRVIDAAKYRKIHEEVMKKLDKLENEFLPQVMVDNTEVIFDTLRFLEVQSRELIIANTGQVPVTFEFIKKLDDSSYCKDWLNIEPYAGFIMPGEKCDIKLEVFVDKKSAFKLNSGEEKLYDILVLHLEGGKDIFITVTGTYERSCFGSSIEALVYIPVPVREIPVGKLMDLETGKDLSSMTQNRDPHPIPKEIWFLVDHLYRHGLKQAHLFEHPGLHSELLLIRNWLDNGSPDPLPGSVHSVAEALLLLLEATSEPIIPYNLHNVCLTAANNYPQCKQIVMQLPEHRKNVFLYLCIFLQEVLAHCNDNGLDPKTVATLFGTIFLRDPPRSRGDLTSRARTNQQALDRKKAHFVYHFLVNDQSDFILSH